MVIFSQLTKVYKLTKLAEQTIAYIERCFPLIVETNSFLELSFNVISKILSSNNLNITSEMEIFEAASSWVDYDISERSKFAFGLLLKVRLPLLTEHALKYLLTKKSPISEVSECNTTLKQALKCKEKKQFHCMSSICHENRFCMQKHFNLLICDANILNSKLNYKTKQNTRFTLVDGCNFKSIKVLPPSLKVRDRFLATCVNEEIFVFGGRDIAGNDINSIEKYSFKTNGWSKVADMFDKRVGFVSFSLCAFMNKILVIGGETEHATRRHWFTNTCLEFNTKDYKWKDIAKMNQVRGYAGCTVFEGSVVVAGGCVFVENDEGFFQTTTNTVESYDPFADKWTPMASLIEGECDVNLVPVRSKLFRI